MYIIGIDIEKIITKLPLFLLKGNKSDIRFGQFTTIIYAVFRDGKTYEPKKFC